MDPLPACVFPTGLSSPRAKAISEPLSGGADEYVLVDELVSVAKIHTLTAFDFLSAEL